MHVCRAVTIGALFAFGALLQGQACAGVSDVMPANQRHSYLEQISKRALGHPALAQITIDRYMGQGEWSAIVTTPPGNERGVFFFRNVHGRPVLKDVWGGVAGTDSAQTIADQESKALGSAFPGALALCFAHAIGATN